MKKRNFVEQNKRSFNSRYPKSTPASRNNSESKRKQNQGNSRDSQASSRFASQKPSNGRKTIGSPVNSQKINGPKKVNIKLGDFIKSQSTHFKANDPSIPNHQIVQISLQDQQHSPEKSLKQSTIDQVQGKMHEEDYEFSFRNQYTDKRKKAQEGVESSLLKQKDEQSQQDEINSKKVQVQQVALQIMSSNDNQLKNRHQQKSSQLQLNSKSAQNTNSNQHTKLTQNKVNSKQNNQQKLDSRKKTAFSSHQSPRNWKQLPCQEIKIESSPKSDKQIKVTQLQLFDVCSYKQGKHRQTSIPTRKIKSSNSSPISREKSPTSSQVNQFKIPQSDYLKALSKNLPYSRKTVSLGTQLMSTQSKSHKINPFCTSLPFGNEHNGKKNPSQKEKQTLPKKVSGNQKQILKNQKQTESAQVFQQKIAQSQIMLLTKNN